MANKKAGSDSHVGVGQHTGAAAPSAAGGDADMQDWHGQFGGSVDGWWAPEKDGTTMTGILVNFIAKTRSEKLQSDSLVFELTAPAEGVKNGGSEKMPGEKGDEKLHTAPAGCQIGVPVWKQLSGMWPKKAGHKVMITRGEKRSIGKGRSMYDITIKMTPAPVRHVEVFEEEEIEEPDTGAPNNLGEGEKFQVQE